MLSSQLQSANACLCNLKFNMLPTLDVIKGTLLSYIIVRVIKNWMKKGKENGRNKLYDLKVLSDDTKIIVTSLR